MDELEQKQKECFEMYVNLLSENRLTEVFAALDASLTKKGFSTDLTPYFVSSSAHYHRTEKEFRLGTISWEQYNISNAQIIAKVLPLAKDLCAFLFVIGLPGYVQHPEYDNTRFRIQKHFESLARAISALEIKED